MTSPGHTGRRLVLLAECNLQSALVMLRSVTGLRIAMSSDFARASSASCVSAGEGMLFENLGVVLIGGDPDQVRALEARASAGKLLLEPERRVRARDMSEPLGSAASRVVPLADTPHAAWGLQATRVLSSRYSGRGARVALLDTGLDLEHPDFAGRAIVSRSFVAELAVDDDNGHGTFAAGVACGPRRPHEGPRYGVACEAELYVARVLDGDARGTDGQVLAGIDWAVRNGCAVVSMSLGAPTTLGDSYPRLYEQSRLQRGRCASGVC
jgi:subtilisin family serine protease